MNKEDFLEGSLISSENSRVIRLYLSMHQSVFIPNPHADITDKEIVGIKNIFPSITDEDLEDLILEARLETLLMGMEKKGLVKRHEKSGHIYYDITNKGVKEFHDMRGKI